MKLATTTKDFDGFFDNYNDKIKCIYETGFKYIDFGMSDDELFVSENWKDNAKKLLDDTEKLGARFVQAHAPSGNPINVDPILAEEQFNKIIRAVEICGVMGIPNIVVHTGTRCGLNKEEIFKKNKEFFEKVFPIMEKNNVNVLCENSTKINVKDKYFQNSGADIKEFVEYINHPLFHACWDIGHGNCEGLQYNELTTIGNDLYALHVHYNFGVSDSHHLPFFGITNFDDIMNALIDVKYKGYFTFEACAQLSPTKLRRTFEKDTRLYDSLLFMKKKVERLMFEMGEYILKQYNCFEE
jgi:sugar phosphate isomerase/epimerase